MRSCSSTTQGSVTTRMDVGDCYELTKPGVTGLIVFATLVGFFLASPSTVDYVLLLHTLFGTALVAGGTAALNQFWERDADAKMHRTRNRPLPAGRMQAGHALAFGVALSVLGGAYLAWQTNWLSCLLAVLTLVSYLFL